MSFRLIVRVSEITLKGGNRAYFEKHLRKNLAAHLKPLGDFTLHQQSARMVVRGEGDGFQAEGLIAGLPGVANVSLARIVPREPEALEREAVAYMEELLAQTPLPADRPLAFRVEASRKDKRYPVTSPDLARRLGGALVEAFPRLKVNLTRPDITLWVEIWDDSAALYARKTPGPHGLAVGSSGTVVSLLSGGIDSPVASYMMMTRGCRVVYLNFHSYPYIGEQSKAKIHEIVRFMARYQPRSRLVIAPFAKIQEAIRDGAPEGLRTVLYRRMMNRVAEQVAALEHAQALVSGDQLGQVASQTLENIVSVRETATLPLLQPLIGLNKQDIIATARKIGTYPLSIQPFPDCCTLFQPTHPETRAKPDRVHLAEAGLDIPALVEACVAGLEITTYGPEYHPAGWE
ncbi:MAG: tRNA 4-thiouridine(8) synthase ThiI [Deltaproteobacteria bacterium]|nr:tRNA 4-thiouridine(8) synthase ThiI [Deltaproteobacteria bacterium]